MITLKIKIGKGMLEFQDNDMKTIHRWSDVWGALPSKCSCGSDDIHLSFTKTQEGYEYCKLKCKNCGATYTIKQSKSGEYYIDPNEKFEQYKSKQQNYMNKNDQAEYNKPPASNQRVNQVVEKFDATIQDINDPYQDDDLPW